MIKQADLHRMRSAFRSRYLVPVTERLKLFHGAVH